MGANTAATAPAIRQRRSRGPSPRTRFLMAMPIATPSGRKMKRVNTAWAVAGITMWLGGWGTAASITRPLPVADEAHGGGGRRRQAQGLRQQLGRRGAEGHRGLGGQQARLEH